MASRSLRDLAVVVETPAFARTMRTLCVVGLVIALASEAAAYVTPAFPKDPVGTGVMGSLLLAGALIAGPSVPRRTLGLLSACLFGTLGWYLARAIVQSGELASPHQGALYVCLGALQALLPFSVLEFALLSGLFIGAYVAVAASSGTTTLGHHVVVVFYLLGALVAAGVGILARTRLQLAEIAARREQERLNANLRSEVETQVARIRRAELLGRYLPPQLSEAVLAGERGVSLEHANREVAILCAVPAGLLETIAELPAERVVPLVNDFVSAMARVAFEHGGIIERFVGPRITVLFGALGTAAPADGVRAAARMAGVMQEEANRLLSQWEGSGLEGLRLRLALGLASGPAVVGTFGSERRAEYSALGGAIVRAHRLAEAAVPGELRLDERSAGLLGCEVPTSAARPIEFTPGVPSPTFLLGRQGAVATSSVLPFEPTAVQPERTLPPAAAAQASLPALAPGTLFDGRYRITAEIGRGGMAVVYRAEHLALGQPRALKLMAAGALSGSDAVEQLRREAESTARVRHPNVVQLIDFGRSLEGFYYLALEHVDGPTLAHVLAERGPLPEAEVTRLAHGIASALEAAHALSIVHRDLKPSNVLIAPGGRPRVTDFGLARAPGAGVGFSSGTPAYMAPEQALGHRVDARSDLYALGVTLFELLTGERPHRTVSLQGAQVTLLQDDTVRLRERAPHVSASLSAVIEQCLAPDPEHRPRSAAEVREALRGA